MFNRRELLIGSILSAAAAPLKASGSRGSKLAANDFVFAEHYEPLSPDVLRELRWGRAGVDICF